MIFTKLYQHKRQIVHLCTEEIWELLTSWCGLHLSELLTVSTYALICWASSVFEGNVLYVPDVHVLMLIDILVGCFIKCGTWKAQEWC